MASQRFEGLGAPTGECPESENVEGTNEKSFVCGCGETKIRIQVRTSFVLLFGFVLFKLLILHIERTLSSEKTG